MLPIWENEHWHRPTPSHVQGIKDHKLLKNIWIHTSRHIAMDADGVDETGQFRMGKGRPVTDICYSCLEFWTWTVYSHAVFNEFRVFDVTRVVSVRLCLCLCLSVCLLSLSLPLSLPRPPPLSVSVSVCLSVYLPPLSLSLSPPSLPLSLAPLPPPSVSANSDIIISDRNIQSYSERIPIERYISDSPKNYPPPPPPSWQWIEAAANVTYNTSTTYSVHKAYVCSLCSTFSIMDRRSISVCTLGFHGYSFSAPLDTVVNFCRGSCVQSCCELESFWYSQPPHSSGCPTVHRMW